MKKFKYLRPRSIEEAASMLNTCGKKGRIIAGGTDLLGQMQDNILPDYPEVLVNLKSISGLDYIREEGGSIHIGALTRLDDIARDRLVKKKYGVLAEASAKTGSPHIREMGTIGGNICQSNRCWYYWVPDNRFYCLRKGGAACYAAIGDGRYHSIFGSNRVQTTPCSVKCPAGVAIPDYISQIRDRSYQNAARTLLKSNPMPAITGRVCPHFCEAQCNRQILDEPVSIRCIERFIGDFLLEIPELAYSPSSPRTQKKVAVIGSGPAGLSAAFYLNNSGHTVIVFESREMPGGLLEYGIPPYRLPKEVVKQQVEAYQKVGIRIKTGVKVGTDIPLEDICKDFDAAFVACGAWQERPSGIKGDEFMLSGLEFLTNINRGRRDIPGKKVAVIGGGNVAIDVARTLLRIGAEPVVFYRRSKNEMPALKEEVEKAMEENIPFEFLTVPIEVYKKGNLTALKCTRMKLGPPDESGRPRPLPVEGSEFTVEFDAVFKALGEGPDISIIPGGFRNEFEKLRKGNNGYLLGGNLFAGGDFVTGSSTVVEAITAGRQAAEAIDIFLRGSRSGFTESLKFAREGMLGSNSMPETSGYLPPDRFNSYSLKKSTRVKPPELSVSARIGELKVEDTGEVGEKDIKTEADRCLNCGCVAVNSSDIAPALIALNAVIKTTQRTIQADNFFTVNGDKTTVLGEAEIVSEIVIPEPEEGTKFKFIKFALRKSIDFPVVNCAASITSENGYIKSARICLNAVYNLPYRVIKAEEYLKGKQINEDTAEAAAAKIVGDALPVNNNAYKIQIARTLVKRVILACA